MRIKMLFNLALNRVGEFSPRALKIALIRLSICCSRDATIASTPQRPVPLSRCFARPGETGVTSRWWRK